jgi:DNA primase
MASIVELKDRIDLHDLAAKLGLKRPGNRGNYRSPHHADKAPSLEIGTKKSGGKGWIDWSTGDKGTCIDLVMYMRGCAPAEAIRILHELYGWPMDKQKAAPQRERTKVEWIAEKCLAIADQAVEYLKGRGIDEAVIRRAIQRKAVGFNDWVNPKVPAGEAMHGGPAVAFVSRSINPGHVVAVDMRYLDPALNGGVKTTCQGEKDGVGWISDPRRLEMAKTVVVVESPINALSIECCDLHYTEAFATRGVANVGLIDWRFLQGKRVLICMDNDEPFPDGHQLAGHRPGPEAAWKLQEILTGLDIASHIVDQEEWEYNDVNDILQHQGAHELQIALKRLEPWLIPGLWGRPKKEQPGRPRIVLPAHEYAQYRRYRVKEDFTT